MKTLTRKQMWLFGLAILAAVVLYAYSIRDSIKVAPKPGCNTCPHKKAEEPVTFS